MDLHCLKEVIEKKIAPIEVGQRYKEVHRDKQIDKSNAD